MILWDSSFFGSVFSSGFHIAHGWRTFKEAGIRSLKIKSWNQKLLKFIQKHEWLGIVFFSSPKYLHLGEHLRYLFAQFFSNWYNFLYHLVFIESMPSYWRYRKIRYGSCPWTLCPLVRILAVYHYCLPSGTFMWINLKIPIQSSMNLWDCPAKE